MPQTPPPAATQQSPNDRVENPLLPQLPESLRAEAAQLDPALLLRALDNAALNNLDRFIDGAEAYQAAPRPPRGDMPPHLAWWEGSSRLWDYGGPPDGAPLLVVPSLINRSYILDLAPDRSLVRHLAAAGFRVFLMDWDAPGEVERGFGLDDYVARRLITALAVVQAAVPDRPVGIIGYCMGGLLALALAALRPDAVGALALLATPFDFGAEPVARRTYLGLCVEPLIALADAWGGLPVDVLQSLFVSLDPFLGLRKFETFADLPPDSEAARSFVLLEDWLNDGVPLAHRVARETLHGWYQENQPAKGTWHLAGQTIDAGRLNLPTLVMVPSKDIIVPPASALALAAAMPGAECLEIPTGHVGMVSGRSAGPRVFVPLSQWLAAHCRA
ncbi:MAG: alpha/beta fold hydrolase [Rhodospirillales bacterium]